ncbi:flagellar protein [Liquorilactobacillus oeni]
MASVPKKVETDSSKQQLFSKTLTAKKNNIKLSNHAQKRLDDRHLNLQAGDFAQISKAITELKQKGSRESLLLYKDMGLIANVHNRTIITAMNMGEISTITNIDSTKFIK